MRWRAPADLKSIETEVDQAIDSVLHGAIADALKGAPFLIEESAAKWHVLKTIPDRSRLAGAEVHSFVGQDKLLRITPLGFAAFSFREDAIVAVQGAVDLMKAHVLFTSAQELAYSEIQGLEWIKETPSGDVRVEAVEEASGEPQGEVSDKLQPAAMLSGLRNSMRKGGGPRATNALLIDLPRGRQIKLVFQDSGVPGTTAKSGAIEVVQNVRRVCGLISEKRRLALTRRA